METPLHYRSLVEVAKEIRDGGRSPVDLTKTMLARIEALEPRLHAYYTVTRERALAAAEKAQREIAAGRYLGPLHGVPIAVKDLCFTAGVRTTGGSAVRRDFVPTFDATVVRRLEAAGRRPARQAGDHRGRHGRVQPRVRGATQPVGRGPVARRLVGWVRAWASAAVSASPRSAPIPAARSAIRRA